MFESCTQNIRNNFVMQLDHIHIMDPRMYNAAMKGKLVYDKFSVVDHLRREEENGYQVTPNGS